MLERVAVVFGERALSRGADVCEDQVRACLGGEPFKVLAVPGRERGREDAWFGPEFRVCVETYAEAIPVDGAAVILGSIVSWLIQRRRVPR